MAFVCIQKHFWHDERKFTMRNVPGEGDCMFLAVALSTLAPMGLGGNDVLLKAISRETRQVVASVLQSQGNLVIQGKRIVKMDRRCCNQQLVDNLCLPRNIYIYSSRKESRVVSTEEVPS
jgi:hypothetical protein